MINNEHQGEPPLRRVWSAIEESMHKMDILSERMKMMETAVERQDNFAVREIERHQDVMREIGDVKQSVHDLALKYDRSRESLEAIQGLPSTIIKLLVSISAIAGAVLAGLKYFEGK